MPRNEATVIRSREARSSPINDLRFRFSAFASGSENVVKSTLVSRLKAPRALGEAFSAAINGELTSGWESSDGCPVEVRKLHASGRSVNSRRKHLMLTCNRRQLDQCYECWSQLKPERLGHWNSDIQRCARG